MTAIPAGMPVYHVRTLVEKRPLTGAGSCIATVPPGLYVSVGGGVRFVRLIRS